MASNQIQQTGSFYLTGSFSASLGFEGTASYAKKSTRTEGTISSGDGIEVFSFNGASSTNVALDTSSAHFTTPINASTGSLVKSASISGNTLNLHTGDGSILANIIASASFAVTASHALNSANSDVDVYDNIVVTVLNYAGQNKYTINGLEAPTLTLSRAGTYRFDLSNATNAGHPLGFREIDDTAYTTGVTQVGTPGTTGAYTEIVVGFDTPVNLRYYCETHGNIMGNLLNVTDMFILSATGSLQGTATNANTASLATRNILTASAAGDTITFTKGDTSTFGVTIDIGATTADSASFSTRVTDLEEFSSSLDATYATEEELRAITASSIITASAALNTITFTKGDGSTFPVSIAQSGSVATASFAESVEYSGVLNKPTLVSGSAQISYTSITDVPAGILSSSAQISADISGAFAETSESLSASIAELENFSSSLDVTYVTEAELVAATASLSSSLTTTDQTISSSVAGLSGSASDARNLLAVDYIAADTTLSSSLTITDQTISSSVAGLSGSASDSRNQLVVDYIAADTTLSASLTITDQTISSSVAGLSGSASDARNIIVSNISGAFNIPDGTVSSSAQTIANLPTGTVSGSAQVTGSTLITGSVVSNTLTFTKGDGSTFDLTVAGGGGSTDTGSLLLTASVSETTMSFTKGDASTFEVYITASVSASYAQTASLLLGSVESASFATTASYAVTASKVDPITALSNLEHFADDTAAAAGGIPEGGLYRNGNFVLIRIPTPPAPAFSDTHYLTGFNASNYLKMGSGLNNFLVQNQPWAFGFRSSNALLTNGAEATMMSTDNGAVAVELDSASSWYNYMYSNTTSGGSDSILSEPTQTSPAYWLWTYNGTTLSIYYNGTLINTNTTDSALPTTSTGELAFGKSIFSTREDWYSTVGVSAIYFANEALAVSINNTAAANNGDISSDAEYSKVDGFINVGNGTLVDIVGTFNPTTQGTLTYTAK